MVLDFLISIDWVSVVDCELSKDAPTPPPATKTDPDASTETEIPALKVSLDEVDVPAVLPD